MEQYNVILNKYPASPRSKRRSASQGTSGSESASGGSILGGSSFTGYWDLITTNAAGEALEEGKEYIRTKYSAVSEKDVVAFSTEEPVADIDFPIASYNQIGLVGVTQGGGLIIDSNGYIRVDESILEGGGFDEAELRKFLIDNHYLTPTTSLYGYIPIPDNPLITAGDSVNNAFKKLELKVVDMVTISTDQTITGQKTFAKTILAQKDVIAFVSGQGEDVELPVASTTQVGMVGIKSGGGIVIDTNGYISVDPSFEGGGGGIKLVVSSGTGNAVTSLTYNKTTKTLTYVKDSTFALLSQIPTALKNPYALSWSGYSSGSYDGSSSKSISIPSNTSQLTNGAGFIKDGNGTFTVLSGSGSSSKYLAGNGTFYTISYNELSGTPDLSVYMPKSGGVFTGNVNMNTGNAFPYYRVTNSVGWAQFAGTSGTYLGSSISGIIQSSLAFAIMGRNANPNMVVFDGGTVKSSGDVVAYSSADSEDIVAVATTSMYGLVKIDGSTIKVNSSGQIYATSSGSAGSKVSASASYTSGTKIGTITVDGTGTTFYVPNKVGTSTVGSASTPIYLSSGTPTACTGSSLFSGLSYSGSTLSVTVAGQTRSVTISGGSGSWNGGTVNGASTFNNEVITNDNGAKARIKGSAINAWNDTSKSGNRIWFNYYKPSGWSKQSEVSIGNGDGNGTLVATVNTDGNGKVLARNGTGTLSDIRYKKNIRDFKKEILSVINCFEPFYYTTINDDIEQIGFSAQAIQTVFPQFVCGTSMLSLDYERFAAVISVQGLKELYHKHLLLENLVKSRQHWELTKDQQIKLLQDTVIRQQNEINELKEGRAA